MGPGRWCGICGAGVCGRPQAHPAAHGQDGLGADLPAAEDNGSHSEHRVYPYLLRDVLIDRPNQVWCADITDIPMRRSFLYLVAVMDWSTRKVLSWRVSNTMDVEFCLEALEDVLAWFGKPDIFNTDSFLVEAVPDQIHTVLTDNAIQCCHPARYRSGPTARFSLPLFDRVCRDNDIEHRPTKPNHPWTNGQVGG